MTKNTTHFHANIYAATIYQLAVALLMLIIIRIIFVVANSGSADVDSPLEMLRLTWHGLRFDLVALAYINSLFILLRILPLKAAASHTMVRITDWVYYLTNSIMLIACMGDIAYYRFSGVKMRWSGLQEIAADTNIGGIVAQYAATYWWMVILGIAIIAGMIWLYRRPIITRTRLHGMRAAAVRIGMFILMASLTFLAMRGRVGSGNPLNIADATWGAHSARQVNVVLNTPFTLLRSIGKGAGIERLTFFTPQELATLRSSIHTPKTGAAFTPKNVMIIILESGGASFIDTLNIFNNGDGTMDRLMPFVDSLARQSLTLDHFMATGRSSNGGANAILASFPAFGSFSYMLSPYNATPFDSPARLLTTRQGYASAFYYGCNHGSFNIDQLAHASGYQRVIDRATYTGAAADYDGTWGIYDTPMGQFVATDLTSLPQPWIASWFTISAHTPHKMPADEPTTDYRYKQPSPQRGLEYTDRSLRRFFDLARKQPWYTNTIFVITADHGNRDLTPDSYYDTPYIRYHLPLIIFAPDGSIPARRITDRAASQFDISPTILSLLSYPHPYIAIGTDILDDSAIGYGISFIDNRYMISSPTLAIFTDNAAKSIEEIYDTTTDPQLRNPLTGTPPAEAEHMLRWAQALLQDFTHRINQGALTSAAGDAAAE